MDGQVPLEGYTPSRVGKYSVGVGGVVEGSAGELLAWSGTLPSPFVDVAGYAQGVVGLSGETDGAYTTLDGTAPAAAIVGGVAGLLKAEKSDLTGEEIESILRLTATDAGTAGFDEATGAGAVDAGEALRYVRDNEFARETASGVTVLTDDLYFTDLVELQGFCRYYNGTGYCARAAGKLRRFTARVAFPSSISPSSAPDVFVRWAESDGTDNAWWYNSNNWYTRYDPFVKSLSITSVDTDGFNVEGYYWDASFYQSDSRLLSRGNVPESPQNFAVAYTVAGSQLIAPPLPPPTYSVSISGPSSIAANTTRTWIASASGGVPPYSYVWSSRYPCDPEPDPCVGMVCTMDVPICEAFDPAGTGHKLTTSFPTAGAVDLRVIVTDSSPEPAGSQRAAIRRITVGSGLVGGPSDGAQARGAAADGVGTSPLDGVTAARSEAGAAVPEALTVASYPNPFASATTVRFGLAEAADVALVAYDALGREVARLAEGPHAAGWHEARFEAGALPSGLYVVRLTAGAAVETLPVTVLR